MFIIVNIFECHYVCVFNNFCILFCKSSNIDNDNPGCKLHCCILPASVAQSNVLLTGDQKVGV